MRRAAFLALGAVPLLAPRAARAQSDADPASSSSRQALRVLLGPDSGERRYRGTLEKTSDGRIVNVVGLEEYLYGVVPGEMSPSWPAGALQAQAICSRTYVLGRSDPRREYDLVPSELDQVYRGLDGESAAATAAVNATAGSVLAFGGRYARVAYSSCCGGRTEAASDAWGGAPLPYLSGVVCTWCTGSPNYRWTSDEMLSAIETRLARESGELGELHDVRVAERDASGRVRTFELQAQNRSALVAGTALRSALGPRVLRSLLVTQIARSSDALSLTMSGGGLGHGVGLCQWGANGMAQAGGGATDILARYFPGTVIADLER